MNVAQLIEKRFGIKTRTQASSFPDLDTSVHTKVLPNIPNRLGFMAINLGAVNIFLAYDVEVSLTRGILLTPNGGSMTSLYEEDFESTCWNVYAMAEGDDGNLFLVEILIDRSVEEGVT